MAKTEFKTIRKETRKLLEKAEGYDVDFKEKPNVRAVEFVAFANSANGGTLLLGVGEVEDEQGKQRGKVVGCKVSDEVRTGLLNKAASCHPPVDVEIYVENTNKRPFLRVDIPSGSRKPYCTSRGTYKIRGDGRKEALLPEQLLDIFVRENAEQFSNRFQEATEHLVRRVGELDRVVKNKLFSLESEILASTEHTLEKLKVITRAAELAESSAEEAWDAAGKAAWETDGLKKRTESIQQDIYHLAWKLNALLESFDIEDPEITREREKARHMAKLMFETIGESPHNDATPDEVEEEYKKLRNELSLKGGFEDYVSLEEAKRWVRDAKESAE